MKTLFLNQIVLRIATAQAEGCVKVNRRAKLLITLALLLTIGVGEMSATTFGGGTLYFYNKGGWSDSYKYLCIGKSSWTEVRSMAAISNTKLWYNNLPTSGWGDATYMAVIGTSNSWGQGAWGSSNLTNANHYTAAWSNSSWSSFDSGNIYTFVPGSTSNGASMTMNYLGNSFTALNNQKIKIGCKISTDGGSSFSAADAPADITGSGYKFSSTTTCSTTVSDKLASGKSTAVQITVGYTTTVTLTAPTVTGYTFVGWRKGTSSTNTSTSATYTFTADSYTTASTFYACYKENKYNVTATASPTAGGSVTPTSATSMGQITGGDIKATANTGYTFTGWSILSGGGGYFGTSGTSTTSTDASTKFRPTKATSLKATFTPNTYTITLEGGDGSDGLATATYNSNTLTGITHCSRASYDLEGYYKEAACTTKIANADGTLVSTSVSGYLSSGYWIATENKTLYANWTYNPVTYTLNFGVRSGQSSYGSVSAKDSEDNTLTNGNSYVSGTSVTVTATPSDDYKLSGWYNAASGGSLITAAGTTNPYTFTLSANTKYYAAFEQKTTTITLNTNGGSGGTTSKIINHGASMTGLTAPGRSGYTFTGWWTDTSSGTKVIDTDGTLVASVSGYTTSSKKWDYDESTLTLYAQWTEKMTTITINASPTGAGTFTVGGSAFTEGNTTTAGVATSRTVVATPISDYTFSSWTASGNATGTNSTNTYTLKGNGSAGTGTLTANFTAIACNLYKLSKAKNGTTTDKGAMTYDNTEHAYYKDVTTDASPYYFRFYYNSSTQYCSDWKDKYSGGYTSGKEIVANGSKVDCDKTVSSWTDKPAMYYSGASGTAIRIWFDYQNKKVWVTEQTYAVTINNGDHGTVSPNGSQQIGGSGLQITATPASGYKFDSWSKTGSVTLSSTTTKQTTVSATGTGTVTANYSLIWAILGSQATNTTTGTDGFGGWSTSNTNALLGNISTSGGKTYGYVDLTLEANKNYQFKIYDRQNGTWYGNGGDNVYYMTSESCSNWDFRTDKSYNCGITTTGAGTYRFTWNLTDKKLTVTYPTSYAVNFAVIPSAAANAVTTNVTGLTTGGYVASGTSVTFTHQAAKTGYTWLGWYNNAEGTGTALGTGDTYTASITQNTDVYAVYTEKEYNVTVSAGAGGTVSPSGTVAVKQISGTTLTATPNAGYAFNGWTKSGSNITLTSPSTNPTTAKATAAGGSVTANFVEDWYICGDKAVMGSWATEWASGKLTADGSNFSITLNLAANTTYQFKLYKKSGSNHYWSNSTDISGKTKSASNVALYYDDNTNMSITTAIAGAYKFTLSDVSSANPKLTIDFPSALQIYRSTPTHAAVIATHAWDSQQSESVYRKTLSLNGNTTYEFKIYDGGEYYTHSTKITTSISNRNFTNSGSDCQLETKSAGNFIFDWDRSSKQLTVHYPQSAIVEATPDKVYSGSTVTFTGYASELGSGSHTVKYEFFKGTTLTDANKVAEKTKTETATHQQVTTDPVTITFAGNTTSQEYTLRVTSDGVVRGTNTCTVYRKWDIYVHDVDSWNAMYYYVYDAEGSHRDLWPGYDYSAIKYNDNPTWYSVALDAQYPYFILDNNEGNKQLKGDQAYATDITTFTPGSFWYVDYKSESDGKKYYDLMQINLTDPTVTLDAPEVVSGTMAYFTGTVTNFGNDGMSAAEMREVGVYIGDTKYTTTCYGTGANTAKFYIVVDGLTAGTTYSARAFALNAHGEGKSAAQSFTTRAHNTYTIKVRASSTPYIYAWSYKADPNGCGAKTEQNRAWPGVAMTSTGVTGAQGTWYEYTMDNTYNQFKVTTGANAEAYTANQTGDWAAPMEDKCYWYWNGTEKASHGNQTMGEMTCPYLTPQLMIETTAGNGEYAYHEMTGTGTVSYSIPLAAETTYKFKIVNNSDWYTNNTKIVYPEDCSNFQFSVLDGSGNECKIGTTYGGTYIFTYNTSANTLSVTYPNLPNVAGTVGLGATGQLSGSGTSAKPYIVFAGKNLTLLTTHSSAPVADSHFKYTYYKGDSELTTKLSTVSDAKQYVLAVGSVAGTYTAKVSAYYEYGLTGHTAKGTAKEATIYYKVIDIPTPTLTLSPTTKVQLGNSVTLTGSVTNETGVAVTNTAWSFLTGTASGSVTTAVSTNSTSPKTHTPTAVGTQYYKTVLNMWGETMTSAEQSITVYVPITVQSNNSTYGTITSATSIEYSSGNATITATKKSGYKFSVWQATEGITIANPKSRNTTFTATQAGTITAVFIPDYGSRWFIRGTTDHNLSDDASTLSWSTDLDEINDDKYELTKESYDGNIAYAYLNFNHDASTGQSVQFKLYNSEAASNKWRGNKTTIVRTATIDYPVNSDAEGNTTLAVTVPGTYTFALDLTTYKLTVTYPEVNLVRGSWDGFVFTNEMTAGTGDNAHIYSWSIDASSLSAFTDYTFFIVNNGNQLFSTNNGATINHNNNTVGLSATDNTDFHFGFRTTTADVSTTTGTRGKYVFHYNTVTKTVTIDYPDLKTPKDITITVKAIQTGTNWWDAVGFHIWGTNGGDDDGDYEAFWVTDKTEGGVNYKYFYYTFHTNGSINFTINKWNKSGNSIYLEGSNQTDDITNVTADHCYTILKYPDNKGYNHDNNVYHKGYHTDEGSCVPLLYKVKTTLDDGTVYYSNEGTQNGDTLSFYATTKTVNVAKYKRNGITVLQQMTSSGWQTLQTLNATQIKESNVYYGVLSTSSGSLTGITKYEGDYYVLSPTTTVAQDFRTASWGSDEKSNAVMTYFPPSENYVDTYRYYHVNWLEGNTVKLKGQVANEYNANLAQYEDIQEPYTTADGKSADEKGVNLRFSYDPETNVFKRTFLAGASDRPDFLTMYDDSLNLKMLNKTDLITKEEPIRYSDGTNWLYMVDSYATIETNKATPHVVLVANFNGQEQYLFEKDEKGIPYNRRLYQKNMTTPGTYKTRVIYDYKTNRIISAWLIDTNTQISSDINLYDNVLFRRINNDTIKNMDIAAANKVAQVNMIYTELEIQRDGKNGWKSLFATGGDGVARYGFYWFSLPYECYVEDIMGLGGKYGEKWYILRYRGDKRAQSGWYLDNSTFWERLSPHGLMKPGEGYVVAVNLAVTDFKEVKVHSSKWVEGQAPDSTVASLRIFFPSDFYYVHTEVKDTNSVYQTVPVHECNIPARRIYDSNWNVIGIPSLEPLTFSSATGDYVYDNETNTAGNPTFVYEWEWNKEKAAAGNYGSGNSFTYTLKSAAGMTFLPTFSYMTQYAGTITWNKNYSSVSQWGSSYGAPKKHNEQKPYRRMELSLRNTDSDELDNTFVYLQDGATDDYDLNLDIVKIFNDGVTNFYSLGAYYETTDQNGNPMTDHVEFGGNVLPVKNTVVPLGIRADRQETMTITLSNKEMITGVVPVLYDKEQDRYTNLLTADYTFSLDRLTLEDRLFLNLYLNEEDIPDGILTDNAVANNDEQYSITAVDGGIIINGISGSAFVRMYDPTGRLMFSGQVEQGQLLNVPVQQAFILNVDGTVVKAVRK